MASSSSSSRSNFTSGTDGLCARLYSKSKYNRHGEPSRMSSYRCLDDGAVLRQYQSTIRPNSPTIYFRFPLPFSVANMRGSKLQRGDDFCCCRCCCCCPSTPAMSSISSVVEFLPPVPIFVDCWTESSSSSLFSFLLLFPGLSHLFTVLWLGGVVLVDFSARRGFEDSTEDTELDDSAER